MISAGIEAGNAYAILLRNNPSAALLQFIGEGGAIQTLPPDRRLLPIVQSGRTLYHVTQQMTDETVYAPMPTLRVHIARARTLLRKDSQQDITVLYTQPR